MPLHIHLENDTAGASALHVSADRLVARLAGIPGLADAVVTENTAPAGAPLARNDVDVLLTWRKLDLTAAKATSPALRWTQVTSAGVEAWLPHLPADMILTNAAGVHGRKAAEFVLLSALMLNFAIPQFVTDKEQRAWQQRHGGPLAGKTVTLLGVGGIGRVAAALLRSFGVVILGVTRTGRSDADLDECHATDALDAVLPRTDILVSSLPMTDATRGLIDRRRLELLPAGAGIVSIGRAGVLDYDALEDLLRSGRLGGAVLDVFPREPLPPEDTLWTCPRLVMTPHCSLDDHASYRDRCLDIFCENLRRFAAGESLTNVVDPAAGY